MVSEKDDDGILLLPLKIGDEFAQRLIAQAEERKIVVQRLGTSLHLNLRVEVVKAFRVGRVVLHGNIEQKQRTVSLIFINLNDFFKIGLIAHIIADLVRVFKIRKEVHFRESHRRIDRIPVPAGGVVGMHGNRLITQGRKMRSQGRRGFVDVLLIGNAALRQECHGISRQVFEFGIGRIPAEHGNVQPAGDGIFSPFKQAVDKGHIVLIDRKIT